MDFNIRVWTRSLDLFVLAERVFWLAGVSGSRGYH
jgi:hypothetical protein